MIEEAELLYVLIVSFENAIGNYAVLLEELTVC